MDRCNEFCSRLTTGYCALCEALAERERFIRRWFKGGWFRDGGTAWQRPVTPPGGWISQPQLADRAERVRSAVDETARLAHTFYLTFLFIGTYIAVIIGSTTDGQLLKISPVTLPLLTVALPIVAFYVVVPWLLLLLHGNLLLHLALLAQRLQEWHLVLAAFTDAAAREAQRARLFPFFFSLLLSGPQAPWRLRGLLGGMVWTMVVGGPLALCLWAQLRFLPFHDATLTWIQRAAVLTDLGLLWIFWPLMRLPRPAGRLAWTWRLRRWGGLGGVSLVTVVVSVGGAVLPEEALEGWITTSVPASWRHADPGRPGTGPFLLTYWLCKAPWAPFHRNLQLREQVLVNGNVSAKTLALLRSADATTRAQELEEVVGRHLTQRNLWAQGPSLDGSPQKVCATLHSADATKRMLALEEVEGLRLTNRDLRGADLRETLLAKADLRGANLQGARLEGAQIFASNFSPLLLSQSEHCLTMDQTSKDGQRCYTRLQGANLRDAQLQGTNLREAQLQGATLTCVQLQEADVRKAQFQEASLREAQLQGAFLAEARLQGATLVLAQLQGVFAENANFRGADLTSAQLQGADLTSADLRGTILVRAELPGALLARAQLQGATLRFAQIGGVDFIKTSLTWSDLRSVSVVPWEAAKSTELEQHLLRVLSDGPTRARILEQLKAAVGSPPLFPRTQGPSPFLGGPPLPPFPDAREPEPGPFPYGRKPGPFLDSEVMLSFLVRDNEAQVLCTHADLLPSCLMPQQLVTSTYATSRAQFLGFLGCKEPVSARGVVRQHSALTSGKFDPTARVLQRAFARYVIPIPAENCPGWAGLPPDMRATLRAWAAEHP